MNRAPASPRVAGPHRSLWAAWRTLGHDPFGILLPTAGILLTQVLALVILRGALRDMPLPWDDPAAWQRLAALAAGLWGVGALLRSPLRGAVLLAGARAMGRASRRPLLALPALASLLVVDGVVGLLRWGAWALGAAPGVGAAAALTAHGAVTLAAVALAAGLVLGGALSLIVRVLFALSPVEAVLGRRPPWSALRLGWVGARGDRLALGAALLTGDFLTGAGGLLCGAGALPGHPIGPLAVLHRWRGGDSAGAR